MSTLLKVLTLFSTIFVTNAMFDGVGRFAAGKREAVPWGSFRNVKYSWNGKRESPWQYHRLPFRLVGKRSINHPIHRYAGKREADFSNYIQNSKRDSTPWQMFGRPFGKREDEAEYNERSAVPWNSYRLPLKLGKRENDSPNWGLYSRLNLWNKRTIEEVLDELPISMLRSIVAKKEAEELPMSFIAKKTSEKEKLHGDKNAMSYEAIGFRSKRTPFLKFLIANKYHNRGQNEKLPMSFMSKKSNEKLPMSMMSMKKDEISQRPFMLNKKEAEDICRRALEVCSNSSEKKSAQEKLIDEIKEALKKDVGEKKNESA